MVLHLAGHLHRNRVFDRGGYLEIETGSTLDYPQTGRIVEVWEAKDGSEVVISYTTISHREVVDELSGLREAAFALAASDAGVDAALGSARVAGVVFEPADGRVWLAGMPADRNGRVRISKGGAGQGGRD